MKRRLVNHVFISPYYSKFSRVEVSENGVLTSSGNFVEYAVLDKVKSSEFSLGNLISIGAFDNMQYVSMSINSDMNFVDKFAASYSETLNYVQEANKSN